MTSSPDTLAAISTPPGRGGIGIVRLSGPAAVSIAGWLLRLGRPLEHMRARFVAVYEPQPTPMREHRPGSAAATGPGADPHEPPAESRLLDEAVVTAFLAPHSYTGDDVVEIAAHGSPVVLEALLSAALARGARLAEPGEFTQRAFLAGRLDLTQAEAVQDLIAARTLEQARAAAQQMGGALSRRLAPAKERLLHLITLLEAGMDFASGELDDVDVVAPGAIAEALIAVHGPLVALARSFRGGALLRAGATLALVGRPNAGKSSLFNRLLERPRAIVTPIPGTTRDTVEESWSLEGIPVRLVDTAGLRLGDEAPADEAERQGIERSREALADADLILFVYDATTERSAEEQALTAELADRPCLLVRNKIDLLVEQPAERSRNVVPETPGVCGGEPLEGKTAPGGTLSVSALQGTGMGALRSAILEALHAGGGLAEAGALNTRRQQESVLAAIGAIAAAQAANSAGLPHEILLLDLHNGLRALDELTGKTTADDILTRIFSTFCIGK